MTRCKTVARFSWVFGAVLGAMLLLSAVAQAGVAAPKLTSPRSRAHVAALPAFTWRPVRRASGYQIEISSTTAFAAGVGDIPAGPIPVSTTGYTNTVAVPDGTYFWRVRAISAAGVAGRWSRIRKLIKRWTSAPKVLSPTGGAQINWPTTPLMLSWKPVPYAVTYQVEIGTTPQLTTLVYGPTNVQGPNFVVPSVLSPGTYYWSVKPIDAAGDSGPTSVVQSFTWSWPSTTTVNESDSSPDPAYQEPSFSWAPIPGASSYEVEVATDPSYAGNSVIIDQTGWTGTYYNATHFYPSHTTLYWRVRAVDAHGDSGAWNDGQAFTDVFDQPTPQNFHNYTPGGTIDDGDMSDADPILRWSPVAGASHYLLSLVPWTSLSGCEFNQAEPAQVTSSTAWTPGGWPPGANQQDWLALLQQDATWEQQEYGWTGAALSGMDNGISPGSAWCFSLIAVRNDAPLRGSTIESAPTILGSPTAPAFVFAPRTASGTLLSGTTVSGAEVSSPEAGNAPVAEGSTLSTTPLIEWNPVSTADGYYIVISSDDEFDSNSIVTGAFTNSNAWAPPVPLPDQTGAYWWEVIPVNYNTGGGVPQTYGGATDGAYAPQNFSMNSNSPLPIAPVVGANVSGMPTFSWHSVEGAANYTLQISADPTFGSPIETDTTDSTTFSTGATLPSGVPLYWRVRANNEAYNLNWSAPQAFTHNLAAPGGLSSPGTTSGIPVLAWAPVPGATSYNIKITTGGASSTTPVSTPELAPSEFFSPGVTTWQVQSVFPGGGTSAFSPVVSTTRTMPPPSHIRARKRRSRILITWQPDPNARDYDLELSTSSEFSAPLVHTITANSAWVPNITPAQAKHKLYWRIATIDQALSVGSYHKGTFR